MLTTKNEIQSLTAVQQARGFFAIVATGSEMFDGERQNMAECYVRLRDGSTVNVAGLPKIDTDNPQPNGDYSISLNANHSDDVRDKGGEGWLFIGNDGALHMYGVFTTNTTANELLPLAKDNMLKFSTEGFSENYDDGFLIYAVAPVLEGNDPGTQIAKNSKKGKQAMEKSEVEKLINESIKNAGVDKDAQALVDQITAIASAAVKSGASKEQVASLVDGFVDSLSSIDDDTDEPDDSDVADTSSDDKTAVDTSATNSRKEKKTVKNEAVAPVAVVSNHAVDGVVIENVDRVNNFIKTKKYEKEFDKAYVEAAKSGEGKAGLERRLSDVFKANDLTFNPDSVSVIPEALLGRITELLQSDGSLFSKLYHFSAPYFRTAGAVVDTTYAGGRTRGSDSEKTSQSVNIDPRDIYAGQIYKFVAVPTGIADFQGVTNASAIVDYVNRELPAKVFRAIEESVLVGGVKNDDGSAFTNAISIVDDATATTPFYASVYKPAVGENVATSVSNAAAEVLPTDAGAQNKMFVTSAQNLAKMRIQASTLTGGNGTVITNVSNDTLAQILGVDSIVTPFWLQNVRTTANTNPNIISFLNTYTGAVIDGNSYVTVGEQTPESLMQPMVRYNTYDFESKIFFGGGLTTPNGAVLIAKAPTA